MKYRVEYFEGEDGQWYTSIKHVNGERLYTSEGYTRRESAVETLENFIEEVYEFGEHHPSLGKEFVLEMLYSGSERDGQQ